MSYAQLPVRLFFALARRYAVSAAGLTLALPVLLRAVPMALPGTAAVFGFRVGRRGTNALFPFLFRALTLAGFFPLDVLLRGGFRRRPVLANTLFVRLTLARTPYEFLPPTGPPERALCRNRNGPTLGSCRFALPPREFIRSTQGKQFLLLSPREVRHTLE